MEKFLIVGLGNYGDNYKNNRHNIGFMMVDFLAEKEQVQFSKSSYAYIANFKKNDNIIVLLKPTTFMNNSGFSVVYWANFYKINPENILILVDDINLKFGVLRYRKNGSNGGHNGLKSIEEKLGQNYQRLRFGIGKNFEHGEQSDFVLSDFNNEEMKYIFANKQNIVDKIRVVIGNKILNKDKN